MRFREKRPPRRIGKAHKIAQNPARVHLRDPGTLSGEKQTQPSCAADTKLALTTGMPDTFEFR